MSIFQRIRSHAKIYNFGLISVSLLIGASVEANTTAPVSKYAGLERGSDIHKISLLLPAVQSVREAARKADNTPIKGLEKLKTLGNYPDSLRVYRSARPNDSQIQKRLSLANKLGEATGIRFSEKPQQISEHRIALRSPEDASASFEVDLNTGNFLFNAGLNQYRGENTTEGLPADYELKSLSLGALDQLGMKLDQSELANQHIGGVNMGVHQEDGGTLIFEKFKTLKLHRQLDGLAVDGDARILFQFGENARVASMVYQWPTIAKSNAIPKDYTQDGRTLKSLAMRRLQPMADKAKSAELTQVELVLYDDGQGILEPAYHIVMERMIALDKEELSMIPYNFFLPISAKPIAAFPDLAKAPLPKQENGMKAPKSSSNADE